MSVPARDGTCPLRNCSAAAVVFSADGDNLRERLQGLTLTVARRFELPGVVRVSLGIENSEEDVDTLIRVLSDIAWQPKAGPSKSKVQQQIGEFSEAAAQRVYIIQP